ncbi:MULTISPECIES: hypothetical protein [Nocardia]|uniref:hypothetical protein n=1 Tax=Nocardia TaxID=1817 RepID=UPI000D68EEEC|nr:MULTISPECIES: hypothetical protein [Nocardia]
MPDSLKPLRLLLGLRGLLSRQITAVTSTVATGAALGDPVIGLVTVELHRLRRSGELTTITTRGGHRHDRVRVAAVGRHHAVLVHPGGRILLPLRFIEALAPAPPPDTESNREDQPVPHHGSSAVVTARRSTDVD